jgi:tripartite motif-containing protein 71
VDLEGRIVVVDQENSRIQIFSSEGEYLISFGQEGEKKLFDIPHHLCIDRYGNILVSDTKAPIQVFG